MKKTINKTSSLIAGVSFIWLINSVNHPAFSTTLTNNQTVSNNLLQAPLAGLPGLPVGVAIFRYIKDGIPIMVGLGSIISSINPQPPTGIIPPLAITFSESKKTASLEISGGDFDTDSTDTFNIVGSYWTTNFGISQDAGFTFDKLGISGSFQHILGPDSDDDLGEPAQFTGSWTSLPFLSPSATITTPTNHPNGHIDVFTASLTGTTSGVGTDIGTWNFVATGTHFKCSASVSRSSFIASIGNIIKSAFITPAYAQTLNPEEEVCKVVPEPSLNLGILAIGTFGLLGAASNLKRKLKSSKSSEKETTKVS
jgi:hypothetical protein